MLGQRRGDGSVRTGVCRGLGGVGEGVAGGVVVDGTGAVAEEVVGVGLPIGSRTTDGGGLDGWSGLLRWSASDAADGRVLGLVMPAVSVQAAVGRWKES